MAEEARPLGLVKFGHPNHMESLLRRGELHCNPLRYFQNLEEAKPIGRADPNDGLWRSYGPSVSKITFQVGDRKFEPSWARLTVRDPIAPHIFSLCAVTRPGPLTINGRMRDLGEAFVVIKDVSEFLRRVGASAGAAGAQLQYGALEYVSRDEYAGGMGPFRKFQDFAWQEEFRLAVYAPVPTHDAIKLKIGSIEDIAQLADTSGFHPTH